MKICHIHHASLIVSDTAQALAFYQGVLGLDLAQRPELGFPGAWLQLGEQQIHLLQVPNPDAGIVRPEHGGRDRHLAMAVAGFDELRQRLEASGVAFNLSRSGRKALFCRDPDDNTLELIAVD